MTRADHKSLFEENYKLRSHEFFRNICKYSDNKYSNDMIMDRMMRVVLDYVSVINYFMDPAKAKVNNTVEHEIFDSLKAKVFWEAINGISVENIKAIDRKRNQQQNKKENIDIVNPQISKLITMNFPAPENKWKYYKNNWHYLHWATIFDCKLTSKEYDDLINDNIEEIVKECNSNNDSFTLAHTLACSSSKVMNMENAMKLLNHFPQLALKSDQFGYLPLHYAAEYCQDKQFLMNLISQNPDAMTTFTKCSQNNKYYNELPIYCATRNKNDEMFKILLELTKQEKYQSIFIKATKEGGNLIHRFCRNDSVISSTLFEFLVNSYPEGVRVPDSKERYPLHEVSKQTDINKVMVIFNIFKEAIKMKDQNNCVPLVYAASYSTVEVFKFLYESYPEGINANANISIITYAINNNFETIKYICKNFPDLGKVVSPSGDVPLHTVVNAIYENSHHRYETVKAVYLTNPEAVRVVDNSGRLPIHYLEIDENQPPSVEVMRIVELLSSDYVDSLDTSEGGFLDFNYTPYKMWSPLSDDMHRLLLSRFFQLNSRGLGLGFGLNYKARWTEFCELNFQARRMGMFLAFTAVSKDLELNIWRKLKLPQYNYLLRYTIAFL